MKEQEEIGKVLGDKYKILNIVGKGGMSVVYLAWDEKLNRNWAIKKIQKSGEDKEKNAIENSAEVEIDLLRKFDHAYLPRIVDLYSTNENFYIVMDFIEGKTLQDEIRDRKEQGELIPLEDVLKWGQQLCKALHYLHTLEQPIIYRDMKPANVMLKPDGDIKIIDFGISRAYKEGNEGDTKVLGTQGYFPPEQGHGARHRQTDPRSDIYALGITLHHLLTGQDPAAVGYKYDKVSTWRKDVSQGIDEIIDKCTAFEPNNRYQNCELLLYDLEHPELVGEDVKREKRKKIRLFTISCILTVVMLFSGIFSTVMKNRENDKSYDEKINISTSTSYEVKVVSYLDAIALYPEDTRAYDKLLEAYKEYGQFTDVENGEYMAVFNANQLLFDTESTGYWDLLYDTGVMYLYMYSGGDDTFRTRVLKSYPYFTDITTLADLNYENYNMAQVYEVLGSFYTTYVVDATSIQEPDYVAYDELLISLEASIDNIDNYNFSDASYIKLTMYREISNLLNDHRQGLAIMGIEQERVIAILETIMDKSQQLSVTQQTSIEIQEEILSSCEVYIDNIERSYINIGEGEGE